MVSDDVTVLRMVWHPFHFAEGELVSTAFDGDDLLALPDVHGDPRYMSVDDLERISRPSVDWRIAWQQRDGRAERNGRSDPKFIRFLVEHLRGCRCSEGRQMCEITREPMAENEDGPGSPANPAHCGVRALEAERYRGLSKTRRKLLLNQMRTQLMKAVDSIIEYECLFSDQA